jgi:hypothetical protein
MRLSSSPSAESARQQRYDRLRRDRAAAQAIRSAYPTIVTLRLDLHFEAAETRVPADQVHVMHPPARAFFEFPCPYADCDGQFNLSDAVGAALGSAKKASAGAGVLECTGLRAKDHAGRQACRLHLHYTITPEYQ